ncbi:MAG: hypothetical protein AB1690_13650 [Candidatus Zixiibacteriota bacterium]|jgi:hypothetical protein
MLDSLGNITNLGIDTTGFWTDGYRYIYDRFGTVGIVAAGILLVALAVLLISKLAKLSFNVFRFVVLPSVVVAFVVSYFLPFPFDRVLPIAVAIFSVVLLIKG